MEYQAFFKAIIGIAALWRTLYNTKSTYYISRVDLALDDPILDKRMKGKVLRLRFDFVDEMEAEAPTVREYGDPVADATENLPWLGEYVRSEVE